MEILTNLSVTDNVTYYEMFHRKDLSFEWFVALFVIYSLTTVLSVFGNILVIIVFTRGRRSRTELRPFLINLALADLIMAVFCMPFTFAHTIYPTWLFSVPMCPIVLFMQLLSVVSSVFINVAIGVDRFLVVIYPLKSKSLQQKSKYVLLSIWIISIAISSVEIPIARTSPGKGNSIVCGEQWPEPSLKSKRDFTLTLFIVTYALPLLILVVAYTVVGYLLWKRTTPGNRDELRDMQQLRSKVKVVKMLILVVTMFGICWLPLHIFNLVVDCNPELLKKEKETLLAVYLPSHWLAMANSFANPIIYGFTNDSFRADLILMLYQCCPCCSCLKYFIPRHNSVITLETQPFSRRSSGFLTGSTRSSSRRYSLTGQANGFTFHNMRHQRPVLLRCATDKDKLKPMTAVQIQALRRASSPETMLQKELLCKQLGFKLYV